MNGANASREGCIDQGSEMMRTAKVLMVTLTMTASLVLGVTGAASAAHSPGATSKTLWCC